MAEQVVMTAHAVAGRLHDGAQLHLDTLQNGHGVLDPRALDGALKVYNVFRKAWGATGRTDGHITYFKLAQALYPNVMNGADAEKKRKSLYVRLLRLQAAGVLRVREHRSDTGQVLGLWWELTDEPPDPQAWPDLKTSTRRHPERARAAQRSLQRYTRRRSVCALIPREQLKRSDPRRRVHRWNPRIGHGAEHRYQVAPPLFSGQTFDTATSLPAPLGLRPGGGQATQVRERRAQAPAAPRPWAALSRCRTAASTGGALAVLDVPRADWPSMAAAAFEARFVVDADGSWCTVGDPWHDQHAAGRFLGAAPSPAMQAIDADPQLAAPPAGHRYVTLSGPWARRLETWCRMYDRSAGTPGAGIRSLLEDVVGWQPADGAPCAGGADPGWPIGLAFFVARLGRRARSRRRQPSPDTARARRRRRNALDWAEGERWCVR